jgi:hypothetical protein
MMKKPAKKPAKKAAKKPTKKPVKKPAKVKKVRKAKPARKARTKTIKLAKKKPAKKTAKKSIKKPAAKKAVVRKPAKQPARKAIKKPARKPAARKAAKAPAQIIDLKERLPKRAPAPELKRPDLVCPAGTPASLRTAVDAGADSVYCGFQNATNARNFPGLNFTPDEMAEGVKYAHERGAKVALALNT